MTDTAQWVELAFFVPAVVGFLLNWYAFNNAVADLHYLEAKGWNGPREVVAKASCRNEGIRAFIQFMFMLLGFYLLTAPPANPDAPTTLRGIAVAAVLIIAEVLLVAKAALDRRDRHRVIAYLTERELEQSA